MLLHGSWPGWVDMSGTDHKSSGAGEGPSSGGASSPESASRDRHALNGAEDDNPQLPPTNGKAAKKPPLDPEAGFVHELRELRARVEALAKAAAVAPDFADLVAELRAFARESSRSLQVIEQDISRLMLDNADLQNRVLEIEASSGRHDDFAPRLGEMLHRDDDLQRQIDELRNKRSGRKKDRAPASQERKRAGGQMPRLRTALARRFLRAYGSLPLGPRIRSKVSGFVRRSSPKLYSAVRRYAGAATLPPPPSIAATVHPEPIWLADIVDNPEYRIGYWRLVADVQAHVATHGPCSHAIVLPFFATGGAEATAGCFLQTIVGDNGGSAVLIAADLTLPAAARFPTPDRVLEIDVTTYFPHADYHAREALLFGALRVVAPEVIHIINSEVGWRLLIKVPTRMRALSRVFGSIFAFQFDWSSGERGRKIGYAETFLRDAMPHLDGLLSDNQRFINDAVAEYGLDRDRHRMHTVYNPVRIISQGERAAGRTRIARLCRSVRSAARLQVLWAGRLDMEKRPDLLLEIARLAPDMDFHVYGSKIVDGGLDSALASATNVTLYGPFKSPVEIVDQRTHHAFIFTSRWEGMPNVVLEFGFLGLPVVAATVGGVAELIDDSTGYPVSELPSARDYVDALAAIRRNPDAAAARATALMKRITQRHSADVFAASVARIPGYLPRRRLP
ncbi:Glycosyl transferase, group 1 (modular protein) [uncultured Defluviicoccus sp.]|uniref:Glycosyl transferase, group 1 (Modular protein) n=1 Tax=metagenome TaxID=256318 RepID=A0A380TC12_9ZZZZ|nr:Glycosyl transferase, group 1 (modular protein) [uncultured Defluviicoccus sp.]